MLNHHDAPNTAAAEAVCADPPEALRAELLHGLVMMAPAPRAEHQRATGEVYATLRAPFDRGREGRVP